MQINSTRSRDVSAAIQQNNPANRAVKAPACRTGSGALTGAFSGGSNDRGAPVPETEAPRLGPTKPWI